MVFFVNACTILASFQFVVLGVLLVVFFVLLVIFLYKSEMRCGAMKFRINMNVLELINILLFRAIRNVNGVNFCISNLPCEIEREKSENERRCAAPDYMAKDDLY